MGSLANSEDPDEMQHNAAFHPGLHCLLRLKRSSEKTIEFNLKIITCDPPPPLSIYNEPSQNYCFISG